MAPEGTVTAMPLSPALTAPPCLTPLVPPHFQSCTQETKKRAEQFFLKAFPLT